MPNWCSSTVRIVASQKSLDILETEFKKAAGSGHSKTDFGDEWLGNLLLHIGMDMPTVLYGPIPCRGQVFCIEQYDGELHMDVESAWGPHISCIRKFCEHFVDDAEVFYTAVEYGNQLFWTNDPEHVGTIIADVYDSGDVPENLQGLEEIYCEPKENVRKILADCLGHDGTYDALVGEIDNMFRKSHSYISFDTFIDPGEEAV